MYNLFPEPMNPGLAKTMDTLDDFIYNYYKDDDWANRLRMDIYASREICRFEQKKYKVPLIVYYFRRTRYE